MVTRTAKQRSTPQRIQTIRCPICGATAQPAFTKYGCVIHDCAECRHRFTPAKNVEQHVRTIYSDDYFHGGGAGYSNYLSEADLLRERGRHYGQLLSKFGAPGRVLDVGAAAGFILQGLTDAGWQGEGIEPNDEMAAHGREQLGLQIATGPFEKFAATDQFDAVTMVQVAAHFVDLQAVAARLRECLRPRGLLLVETWNVNSWPARILGRCWHEYSPPSVLHWFSETTLDRWLATAGLTRLSIGRPHKELSCGHARSLLQAKLGQGLVARALTAPLGLIPEQTRIPYPSADLFWALYVKA